MRQLLQKVRTVLDGTSTFDVQPVSDNLVASATSTCACVLHLWNKEHGRQATEAERKCALIVFKAVADRCRKTNTEIDFLEVEERIAEKLGAGWSAEVIDPPFDIVTFSRVRLS